MESASVVQMLVSGQNDLNWFNSNITKLQQDYNNKFIAFCNKKVLESDSKLDGLMGKLRKKGIDTSSIFVKFVSRIKSD